MAARDLTCSSLHLRLHTALAFSAAKPVSHDTRAQVQLGESEVCGIIDFGRKLTPSSTIWVLSMIIQPETLSRLAFFRDLPEKALARIAVHAQELSLSPEQIVALEGEACRAVYFPVRGILRARRVSLDGREQVLSYVGPGGSINVVPALDGGGNVATLDALNEAVVLAIPCEEFRQIVSAHQETALALAEHLASEVRRLSDMVESLALHTVRARLARFLMEYAEGSAVRRRWTQEEIAGQIGTVREMVGRTLRAFEDEGWVRRERGRLVVVDRKALDHEAEGPR